MDYWRRTRAWPVVLSLPVALSRYMPGSRPDGLIIHCLSLILSRTKTLLPVKS